MCSQVGSHVKTQDRRGVIRSTASLPQLPESELEELGVFGQSGLVLGMWRPSTSLRYACPELVEGLRTSGNRAPNLGTHFKTVRPERSGALAKRSRRTPCHVKTPLGGFLERVRAASVPVVFTISLQFRGTPLGEAAAPLKRRDTEPVLYPDAFDKFAGGELQAILSAAGTENLIVVGSLTNVAVLYTATAAARVHRYNVVIPLDGVNAKSAYEHEYAIHHLTVIPAGAADRMRFTRLDMIDLV